MLRVEGFGINDFDLIFRFNEPIKPRISVELFESLVNTKILLDMAKKAAKKKAPAKKNHSGIKNGAGKQS